MTEVVEVQLALGFILTLGMMSLVYRASGVWARRRPVIFFIFGVFIAISGVLIVAIVDETVDAMGLPSIKTKISNFDQLLKYAKLIKEVIEVCFIAAGAGLITLAMDIRSDEKLETAKKILIDDEKQYENELADIKNAPESVSIEEKSSRARYVGRLEDRRHNLEKRRTFLFGE